MEGIETKKTEKNSNKNTSNNISNKEKINNNFKKNINKKNNNSNKNNTKKTEKNNKNNCKKNNKKIIENNNKKEITQNNKIEKNEQKNIKLIEKELNISTVKKEENATKPIDLNYQKNQKKEEKILNNYEEKNIKKELNNYKKISKKIKKENQKKEKNNNNFFNKKIVLIIILLFFIIIFSFIFGLITSLSPKIISGISINKIDISNMTKEDAINKLKLVSNNDLNKTITLKRLDYTTNIEISSLEASYDYEKIINEAFNIGRNENIFINNINIIKSFFIKKNINMPMQFNKELLNKKIDELNENIPDKAINSSYKIEGNNLIISNSSGGYRIIKSQLINDLSNAIINNTNCIEIPVEQYNAEEIDIEKIYKEIKKQPIDAYLTKNPLKIHKEETGLDFNISLDEAKQILETQQESYTIPLKTIPPKITVNDLGNEAFPDELATYSTTYSTSNTSRSTNISLAAQSCNGVVLMPGEEFSYNNTVGQRTATRGYKEAGVYLNGEVTTGLGGGICQVSSTLYNAVLLANLEVTDRTNHTFEPSYVPAGQDATVSWGAPDFKFKNNRNYPIKLISITSGGKVSFNILGLKTEDDYTVKIESKKIGTIPFTTQYQKDSSLSIGKSITKQGGSNGCKTQTYKILYKNGQEISRTLINSDTYKPHNQVIAVGTAAPTIQQ